MILRKTGISAALAALFVLAGCNGTDQGGKASGSFEAQEVIVSSEADGRIVSLDVDEGRPLAMGEVCGLVDTVQLYLQRRQLMAGIDAALSRRQDVKVQTAYISERIAVSKKERQRVKNLVAADAANRKDLDDIDSEISLLERELAATKASLEQGNAAVEAEVASLEAQIAMVDERLSRCRIASPIDGVVLVKYAQQGELTAAGKPLFKVADVSRMILRAYITAGELSDIRLGQRVKVYADSGEQGYREYDGEVSWISDVAEFTPKTIQTKDERANLVYAVKITVINDGYLKIGMYGEVR